jgi:hypothetical protein
LAAPHVRDGEGAEWKATRVAVQGGAEGDRPTAHADVENHARGAASGQNKKEKRKGRARVPSRTRSSGRHPPTDARVPLRPRGPRLEAGKEKPPPRGRPAGHSLAAAARRVVIDRPGEGQRHAPGGTGGSHRGQGACTGRRDVARGTSAAAAPSRRAAAVPVARARGRRAGAARRPRTWSWRSVEPRSTAASARALASRDRDAGAGPAPRTDARGYSLALLLTRRRRQPAAAPHVDGAHAAYAGWCWACEDADLSQIGNQDTVHRGTSAQSREHEIRSRRCLEQIGG